MTQVEFAKWLDSVLENAPLEELVSPEVLQQMDRIHLESEERAWRFAKMEDRTNFELAVRAMAKTLFIVGYATGREQGDIDQLFSADNDDFDWSSQQDSSDNHSRPTGLMPA